MLSVTAAALTAAVFWFLQQQAQYQTVQLYYYNPELDKDASGNIMCSREGLVAVERRMPKSQTIIEDTIRLLLQGKLAQAERIRGVATEFPLAGVLLKEISLSNGILALALDDPQNKTSGGACRAGILWFQIEKTAQQFAGVLSVRFSPEWLFQP